MRPATTIDSTPRTFAVVSTFDHPTDQRHGIQDRQPRSRGRLAGLHRALALGIALVNIACELCGPRVSDVPWHRCAAPHKRLWWMAWPLGLQHLV
jgi:hypothetical protein